MTGLNSRQIELLVLGGVLLIFGLTFLVVAFRVSNPSRAGAWSGLGSGLLTGAIVAIGLLAFQIQLTRDAEEPTWRANVAAAASIPGFDPHVFPNNICRINFSGKDLHDADLSGLDLSCGSSGLQMRDTNLAGAHLQRANLSGADLIGANLKGAVLTGTDLSKAQLQAANFQVANVEDAESLDGAVASDKTCWPRAFLAGYTVKVRQLDNGLLAAPQQPPTARNFERGRMDPDCLQRVWPSP